MIKRKRRRKHKLCSSNATNNLTSKNRRCALSATSMRKPEEEKDARSVTCFMEENEISLREVARFDEHKRLSLKWEREAFC